jgi:dynein heavy chain 2
MVVGELIKINNMYQFSLASFIKLFKRSLETKPHASSTEEKLNYLQSSLIRLTYSEIARSLFKADRLTYSLQFVKGIFPNMFGKDEWEFFTGQLIGSAQSQVPNWVPKDRQEAFKQLGASLPAMVMQAGLESGDVWMNFIKDPSAVYPEQVAKRTTPFQN